MPHRRALGQRELIIRLRVGLSGASARAAARLLERDHESVARGGLGQRIANAEQASPLLQKRKLGQARMLVPHQLERGRERNTTKAAVTLPDMQMRIAEQHEPFRKALCVVDVRAQSAQETLVRQQAEPRE